jgi:hypothetical protein
MLSFKRPVYTLATEIHSGGDGGYPGKQRWISGAHALNLEKARVCVRASVRATISTISRSIVRAQLITSL